MNNVLKVGTRVKILSSPQGAIATITEDNRPSNIFPYRVKFDTTQRDDVPDIFAGTELEILQQECQLPPPVKEVLPLKVNGMEQGVMYTVKEVIEKEAQVVVIGGKLYRVTGANNGKTMLEEFTGSYHSPTECKEEKVSDELPF